MKKTFSRVLCILLSLVMVFGNTAFAVPVLDTAESADEAVQITETTIEETADEEQSLAYLAEDNPVLPGYNVYTGTDAALDFETALTSGCTDKSHLKFGCGYSSAVVGAVADETANTALTLPKINLAYPHFAINIAGTPVIEAARPAVLTFKYKSTGAFSFYLIRNVTNNTTPNLANFATVNTNGNWASYSKVISGNTAAKSDKSNHIYKDDTQDIKNLVFMIIKNANAADTDVVYIDDITLVPYYKLSYDANGGSGTVPESVYFEGGTYSSLAESTGITRLGYTFKGWGLSKDATTPVTSVTAVKGKDIVLYAIWEEIKPGLNILTGSADVLDFEEASDVASIGVSNANYVFVDTMAKADDTDNKGMFIIDQYDYFYLKGFPLIEKNRPLKISFDYYYNGQARITANEIPSNGVNKYDIVYLHGKTANTWNSFSGVRQGDTLRTGDSGDYRFFLNSVDISQLYFYAYSASTSTNASLPLVYDNISVVPYYAVKYDANGGEGTAETDYFESGTYSNLDDGSGLTRTSHTFAGWSLTPGGEIVTSVTAQGNKDITLYAVWERKLELTPGLNILTGTSEAYDFEGNNSLVVFSGTASETENAVVVKATADNANNKAAAIAKNKAYFYFKGFPKIEKERPVDYSFDYVYGGQLRLTVNGDTSGYQAIIVNYIGGGQTTEWAANPYTANIKSNDPNTNGGDMKYAGGEDITNLYFMNYSGSATTSYFDNISIIPYHKVNYDANGGEGAPEADYFKNGTYSDLDDGVSLYKPGYLFDGWSLTANGDAVDSVTAVPGKDITLYARWKDGTVTVEFKGDIEAIESTTATVGTEFDLSDYLDVTLTEDAIAEGKHFNGWSLTGETADLTTDKILLKDLDGDAVVTLYAVVNYDINLALEANRALFESDGESVLSAGDNGDTLKVSGTQAVLKNGTTVSSDDYMGAVVYFANDFVCGEEASAIDSISTISGLAFKAEDGTYTYAYPDKLDGFGTSSSTFNASLEAVTDNSGRTFKGVPVTLESSQVMSELWGSSETLAVALLDENAEFEVRYIRFVPYKDIDTAIAITAPEVGEAPVTSVSGTGYTAEITWSPEAENFDYGTVYTATVKITTNPGYTTKNVAENGYTVANATVTNNAGSDTFTAVFAKTVNESVTVTLYNADNTVYKTYTVPGESKLAVSGAPATVSGSWFKGWQNKDGTFIAYANIWPAENLELYPVYEEYASSVPGVNMFANADAEGTGFGMTPANGMIEIVEEEGNELNHIYKYTRGSGYTSVQHPLKWEVGRKYLISYRVKTNFTNAASSQINIIHSNADHVKNARYTNVGEWVTHTYSFEFTGEYTEAASDALSIYMNPNQNNAGGVVYYDDLMLTPYYRITYEPGEGVGEEVTQWWLPENGNTSYTLSTSKLVRRGYNFLGWSVDGKNVITEYAPENNDVTFVAVWEEAPDQQIFTYDLTSDTAGVADGTMIVVAEENAGYTSAEVYMADENGVMDEYTAFAIFEITDGIGSYVVDGRRAFADGATSLIVTLKGEGVEDYTYTYTIPEANRLTITEKTVYSFFVVSDPHLGGNGSLTDIDYFYMGATATQTRKEAMGDGTNPGDVFRKDENGEMVTDFVIVNGDLVNYGHDETYYWNILDRYIDERLNIHGVPVFLTNGNHEFYSTNSVAMDDFLLEPLERIMGEQLDYLDENHADSAKIIRDENNPGALYYAADIGDYKFIFMSIPELNEAKTKASFKASEKQLRFIEDQLFDGEKSNKTTFLISHVGLSGYINGSSDGISNSDVIEQLLERHPNTIVCSAHSHSNLAVDVDYTVVGDMRTQFTHTNDGATSYLSKLPGSDAYTTDYSSGQYIQIYDDKIIMSARRFDTVSQYFGHALYIIDVPGGNKTLPDVAIKGVPADGETLTALVNGEIPADDAGYIYEWYVGSNVIGTGKTLTFKMNDLYLGKHLRLRVTDKDGDFASCNSQEVIAEISAEPETLDTASIRLTSPQGIRYACFIDANIRELTTLEEYGFIVASAPRLLAENPDDTAYETLKFNANGDKSGKLDNNVTPYASAPAFVKNGADYSEYYTVEDAQKIFPHNTLSEIDSDGYYFTVVLTHIPEAHYNSALVGKPYIKINGKYFYGEPVVKSIYDVALELKAKYEADEKAVPEYITNVINTVESNN